MSNLRRNRRLGVVVSRVLPAMLVACTGSGEATTNPSTIFIFPNTASLQVGDTLQLNGLNSQGAVTWASNNTSVVTVAASGVVSARSAGAATVSATDTRGTATAALTVIRAATLVLSGNALSFTQLKNAADPPAATIQITDGGDAKVGAIAVDVSAPAESSTSWISATLSGTSAPSQLTVRVSAATLVPGVHSATVALTAAGAKNGAQIIVVTFTVLAPASITLSATAVSFEIVRTQTTAAQSITITNGGTGTVDGLSDAIAYQAGQPTGWLSATFSSTSAPTTLIVTPALGALANGTYNATISVAAPGIANSPQIIVVTLVVKAPPTLATNFTSLVFTISRPDSVAPPLPPVALFNSGGGSVDGLSVTVTYTAGQPTGWLRPTLDRTSTLAILTVLPVNSTLPPGTYNATILVTSTNASNGSVSIAVTLTVRAAPTLKSDATAIVFSGGGANSSQQVVLFVSNIGGGVLAPPSAMVRYAAGQPSGWLTVQADQSQRTSYTIPVTANFAGYAAGTYNATIELASANATNTPLIIPVTLTVTGSH